MNKFTACLVFALLIIYASSYGDAQDLPSVEGMSAEARGVTTIVNVVLVVTTVLCMSRG